MVTLSDHIKTDTAKTRAEWADAFGISRPYLYGLLDGTRSPSIDVAARIEAVTGGAVPIRAWPKLAAVIDAAERGAA
jgi:plasmid maintenance system antidote protein VapI